MARKVWEPVADGFEDETRTKNGRSTLTVTGNALVIRVVDYDDDMLHTTFYDVRGDYRLCRLTDAPGVPDDIATTIRESLKRNRMKPLTLTMWDEEHARRIDRALAWLDEQKGARNGDAQNQA